MSAQNAKPRLIAATNLLWLAVGASASDGMDAAATAQVRESHAASMAMPVARGSGTSSTFLGEPLDAATLQALRGGGGQVSNRNGLDGEVGNNTADRVVTGGNSIDGGAFAHASGINTVIQNSGANVLIQNAMVVNVQFTDPGR